MAVVKLISGKVVLKGGKVSCTCCECLQPALQWDSRSASKTKVGFAEWPGFVSSPPKRYLVSTWSGYSRTSTHELSGCTGEELAWTRTDFSGSGEWDPVTGLCSTSTKKSTFTDSSGALIETDRACDFSFTGTSFSATEQGIDLNTCTAGSGSGSSRSFSNRRDNLSVENTTANLKAITASALPGSFPGTWAGTAGSYFNLTSNELTNSIRESKYRFAYTVPSGGCYRIEWLEDGEPKSWQWDGTGTAGETAYTPEYTIPIPETNKTATVTDVVASCTGCT